MPTEQEVRDFLRMNALQKMRLKEKNPERYNTLFTLSNELYPANDSSVELEISDKGDK